MKRIIAILIILGGMVCLGVGCYLNFRSDDNTTDNDSKKQANEDVDSITEVSEENIMEYSEYSNYKLKLTATITAGGASIESGGNVTIDVKNNVIYATLSAMGVNEYIYYDINNNMHYFSSDNTTWKKNTNEGMSVPDFSNFINKIKELDNVTKKENGEYTFKHSLVDDDVVYDNINVTILFDKDGYLSKISFDLSDIDETFDKYIITYEFSDINIVGDVVIPETIVNGATESNETTDIDFFY